MVSGLTREAMEEVITFLSKAADAISNAEKEKLLEKLLEAYRAGSKVFVVGAGRTGLVMKSFALRLMHLGYPVFVFGETLVPSARKGDLLLAASGSGRTRLVVTIAEAARGVGVTVVGFTSYPDSPLAKLSDLVVRIPGRTKMAENEDYFVRQVLGQHEPLTPLGTLFEITLMVFLDGLVVELMNKLGKTEEDLRSAHANIE
ncbi:MAG: 6-phospho-3-hexuloisomerase [Desulfurococcaceae archaeon]